MKLLNKLHIRLVLWTVTIEAILLMIFALTLILALQNSQNQHINETLKLSAAQMEVALDIAVDEGLFLYNISPEDYIILGGSGVFAWILNPDGAVGAVIGVRDDTPLPKELPPEGKMIDTTLADGNLARILVVSLKEDTQSLGTLVLALSLHDEHIFMQQMLLSLMIAIPLVLSLSAAGGLFLANRALSPVVAITATARQISADDLSQRLNLNLPDDEIGRLARTFDDMLARLDDAFQREHQLTSDVSHELRTPLAMLKTQLSLARSRPRDASELIQMMQGMEGDVNRMTHLIDQMLTLARIEQRGFHQRITFDMGILIENIVSHFQDMATAHHVRLVFEHHTAHVWMIEGDIESLRQVVSNLIDNAIKYANVGGLIHISISRVGEEMVIVVSNTGDGIDAEHIPHLFERFYRVDSARARHTGGFGLGLAIAQAIIQAHHGKITVESQLEQGTSFIVRLPTKGRDELQIKN